MFAVIVTLTLVEGAAGAFLPLIRTNALSSVRDEPGCRRFDVAWDPARPDVVGLYELYDDAAAFEAHLGSAHFKTFDTATAEMIAAKAVQTFGEVTVNADV